MFEVQEVTDLEMAFGCDIGRLMPPMDKIPDEIRRGNTNNKWVRFQGDWFFGGLKNLKVDPKDGVDVDKAFRHLKAIQGSFEPSHEDKVAAVAYLCSQWFNDLEWDRAK